MGAESKTDFEVLMLKDGRWQMIEMCRTLKDAMAVMEGERATARGLRVVRETYRAGRGYETVVLHEWVAEIVPRRQPLASGQLRRESARFAAARKPPPKPPSLFDKFKRLIGL